MQLVAEVQFMRVYCFVATNEENRVKNSGKGDLFSLQGFGLQSQPPHIASVAVDCCTFTTEKLQYKFLLSPTERVARRGKSNCTSGGKSNCTSEGEL